MLNADRIIGLTDSGEPIVLPDHSCAYFIPGKNPTLDFPTCWYCRYADFRKRTDVMLTQSICHCPDNRVDIIPGSENEHLGEKGGTER
ncbi:hypothetical protein H8790_11725 [Oscillibacter hominis]|uniref:Uncharacterized protein n=1 Tax=Oscillibacter hominis TaxID=2763056 RepID=A0A7G9B3G5_9FIRM|nr:hypothetical protein [Oscillibacter hominis]QNL44096.1 hypothetical protein H8790_11725 [Oscillibacter hominis]